GTNPALQVWEEPSGQSLWTLTSIGSMVRSVTFSPDGRRLAIYFGAAQAHLGVWEVATGKPLWPPIQQEGFIFGCRFTPDGRHLVTVNFAGTALVYDAETGHQIGD